LFYLLICRITLLTQFYAETIILFAEINPLLPSGTSLLAAKGKHQFVTPLSL